MSVKINYNQKQEKCLIDLFNHHNAGTLGFSVNENEVSFDVPADNNVGTDRDTKIVMRTTASGRLRGQTILRYNRLNMAQMPVDPKSLMITLTSQHQSTRDLVSRLNAILGLQLKSTDIEDDPITIKQMNYGITKRVLRITPTSLLFKGQFEVGLIREEPLSLSRPPVHLQAFSLNVKNPGDYKTVSFWKDKWAEAKKIGSEQSTLKPTKPFLAERYLVKDKAPTDEGIPESLVFWYKFYPEGK